MSDSAADAPPVQVDACVHPFPRYPTELRDYFPLEYRQRFLPGLGRHFYPPPVTEFSDAVLAALPPLPEDVVDGRVLNVASSMGPPLETVFPGSDPEVLQRDVLAGGVDHAVLVPFTRGLIPDPKLANVVCEGTNRWLAEVWLQRSRSQRRLWGSIRINPDDPDHAVTEIARWADQPGFVQVAVPMQSHHPYGEPRFHPVWEAAAEHGLPVAVAADRANVVEFDATYVGAPTHFIEFASQYPLVSLTHLVSLIAHGVFDRIPDVRFVFTDGAFDLLNPIIWRFDKDWRPAHVEVPWVRELPSDYLLKHVRFCSNAFEGPPLTDDPDIYPRWLEVSRANELLMHASHYPFRHSIGPSQQALRQRLGPQVRGGTARSFYGLPARAATHAEGVEAP